MLHIPWQITAIPKPALRTFWEDSLTTFWGDLGSSKTSGKVVQGPAARWHTVSTSFHDDKCWLPLIVTTNNLFEVPTNQLTPKPTHNHKCFRCCWLPLHTLFNVRFQKTFPISLTNSTVQVWRKFMKKCTWIVWLHLSKVNKFKFRSQRVVFCCAYQFSVAQVAPYWAQSGSYSCRAMKQAAPAWSTCIKVMKLDTVDGSEIRRANQLRLLAYPIIYKVFFHPRCRSSPINK